MLPGTDGAMLFWVPARRIVGSMVTSERSCAHRNYPNQEAGGKECAPVVVSNSLMFLNETQNMGLTEAQTGIDAMKTALGFAEGVGSPWISGPGRKRRI